MEALHQEVKSNHFYSFILFYAHLNLFKKDGNSTRLQHALAYFLGCLRDIAPEHMRETWVSMILEAYRLLRSPKIDDFWQRLTPEQHVRLEILKPYCRALIARGEPSGAQRIIGHYQNLNLQTPLEPGIKDLIDELVNAESCKPTMSQLVQIVSESLQRNTVQLRTHYNQIVSKDFEDYVDIVSPGQLPHVFLKNAMLEVAQEIILRKNNLQINSESDSVRRNFRITKEDLINDWFTSLFDKRMAEARVGIRDQKRGGQSASGNGPGEIDGFITTAKNRRIAIFEAFRLFSLDTTVIFEHLDKMAGYDHESLSPVFIAAYCDASDFSKLVRGYAELIAARDYTGFTVETDATNVVEPLHDTDHLWLGMEHRRRDRRDIIFYHMLLNLRCSPRPSHDES
jgi:uncharacterized protein YacL (UPF0231 family)